jgi:DNA invertase Pin-like site-specific DNA recombinase
MADKKIALVVRVSDVKARDKAGDRFISPELQIAGGSGYAAGRGYAVEVIEPQDLNVSHTTPLDERPGMGAALAGVEAGKYAGIVVSSQDRLGPLAILTELKERLLAAGGVLLVPDNPGAEVLDAKGYAKLPGDLVAQIHTAQREEIGLRWTKAVVNAKERGVYVGPTPVGFDRLPDSRLRKNADALAVEQAFRVKAGGGSWSETARVLEAAGVLTPGRAERWSTNSVRSLIANPIYRGDNGPHHFKEYEVVPADVWAAAQSRPNPRNEAGKLERNGRQDGGRRLLGGLIFCGSCGHRMAPTATTKPNGTRYTYYQCKERTCGAKARAVAAEVETYAVRNFFRWVAHRPIPHAPDLTPLEAAVATAAESVKQWEGARDSGDFNPSDVLRGLERARERHGEAEQALWHAREEAGLNDERLSLAQRWGGMTVEERRAALKRFEVKAIVQRGKESVDERVTIELRGSPVGPGWEPDLEYDDPSDEELARRIAAVHAINTDPDAAAAAAAWDAKYADARIIIKPLVSSEEDKALEEKIFGSLE